MFKLIICDQKWPFFLLIINRSSWLPLGPSVRVWLRCVDKYWKNVPLYYWKQDLLRCVIEAKCTNDPGRKSATWCLKIYYFDCFFFQKKAINSYFYVALVTTGNIRHKYKRLYNNNYVLIPNKSVQLLKNIHPWT